MRSSLNLLNRLAAEHLLLAPGCGMKYLTREAAFGKLSAMVPAAREWGREYGGH